MSNKALRVLLVEDEPEMANNLFEFLEPQGYVLDHAADGVTGLHLAVVNDYDVIVLDINLPGINGLDICQRLRQDANKATPVLMLTARDTLEDKLEGFKRGGDDYLVKPFDLPELEARIRVLSARIARTEQQLKIGDLTFDLGKVVATREGQRLALSRICERMLEKLMRGYPNVVERKELEAAVWGDEPPDSDALRSHIYSLRQAIDAEFEHKMLHTVHRLGYRLVAKQGDE